MEENKTMPISSILMGIAALLFGLFAIVVSQSNRNMSPAMEACSSSINFINDTHLFETLLRKKEKVKPTFEDKGKICICTFTDREWTYEMIAEEIDSDHVSMTFNISAIITGRKMKPKYDLRCIAHLANHYDRLKFEEEFNKDKIKSCTIEGCNMEVHEKIVDGGSKYKIVVKLELSSNDYFYNGPNYY